MVEEAAATALELHEAAIQAGAARRDTGESDLRARHRQLVEQLKEDAE